MKANNADVKKVTISKDDQYLFANGTHYEIYNKLGAHPSIEYGKKGVHFGVWAPNASEVYVIGEFNDWNENAHPMMRLGSGGIYSLFIEEVPMNALYKYLIVTPSGERLYKADPFANYAEFRPGTASKTTDLSDFNWKDKDWLEKREVADYNSEPLAIYECHIGSWMRHPREERDGFYTYREFADRILEYLKEFKYTHVELMGIAEYPYDGSWGYQVTGYYAPTSRYGDPKDFMYLIDLLHRNGIGVILDWVPAHFPRDAHGLAMFDGTALYEHPDSRLGEHPDWGTKIFNYSKTEVVNFLIANALFWINVFHVDGLRVDAVASMLYLDYGKNDGEWLPNKDGGNKNYDAIEFFKHLNSVIGGAHPGVMTIAEESTAWPKVTAPIEDGGLGFSFKWNMGWMHDFCQYIKVDPLFRKGMHHTLTFAMSYNEAENYILPLSHDEVVHLKCSMVEKMPGYKKDKYANLRAAYTFMFGHSGKKLLFMGQDFGQEREWSEERELDWDMLSNPFNSGMHLFVKELLKIYTSYPSMYINDNSWDGFAWISCNDTDKSVYSFYRKSEKKHRNIIVVVNMTPIGREDYRMGVPNAKKCKLLLNSDSEIYGGFGGEIPEVIEPDEIVWDDKSHSITFDLPPLGGVIFVQ